MREWREWIVIACFGLWLFFWAFPLPISAVLLTVPPLVFVAYGVWLWRYSGYGEVKKP
jgi:Sec-independent protein secretion pathway component TatC